MTSNVTPRAATPRALVDLRRESQAQFELLTEILGKVHQALNGIGGDFDCLTILVNEVEAARAGSGALQTACASLAEHLSTAHSAIGSNDLTRAIADGLDAVETLQRECRQLSAIASMTRVTGHSVKIDAIEDYIVSLRGMIKRLAATTFAVQDGLGSIGFAVRHAIGQLGEASSRAHAANGDRALRIEAPENDDIGGSVRDLAEQLQMTTQSNTGILMTGIQFSDAFAQRLDHAETVLQAGKTEHAANLLAAAQIAALTTDAMEMLTATRDALEKLGNVGQAAVESLAGDTGERTTELLAVWQEELDEGNKIERLVAPALEAAMDSVKNIDTAISSSRQNLQTLSETALEVSLATVNAGLLAMRSGTAKAAMNVLSTTVRERAHACSDLKTRCLNNFARIDTHTQNADFGQLATEAEQLRNLIMRADADLKLASEMFARLETMQRTAEKSAQTLQNAVAEGLQVLSEIPDYITQITCHMPSLRQVELSMDDIAALARFELLYTMDSEREVHAKLTGVPLASSVTAAGEAQSMDDIFF